MARYGQPPPVARPEIQGGEREHRGRPVTNFPGQSGVEMGLAVAAAGGRPPLLRCPKLPKHDNSHKHFPSLSISNFCKSFSIEQVALSDPNGHSH